MSCLVRELILLTHDRYANSMLYKKDNQVEGTTIIPKQMLAAKVSQAKTLLLLMISICIFDNLE